MGAVAAADPLDAALGEPGAATTTAPELVPPTTPAAIPATSSTAGEVSPGTNPAVAITPASEPAKTEPAIIHVTEPATTHVVKQPLKPLTTNPADLNLLEKAVGQPAANQNTRFVFIDGRWVPIPTHGPTTNPALAANSAGVPVPTTNEISVAVPAEKMIQQRIIRIPIIPLRSGVSKYNIVVRPGDVIHFPSPEQGEFYLMGNAGHGVYALTGRKITLKQAIAAGGGVSQSAVLRRCDLIRRIGNDQEVTMQLDLQKIFDGEQPDIFLKPNDIINVGTDAISQFVLMFRNAFTNRIENGFLYNQNNNNGGSSGFLGL